MSDNKKGKQTFRVGPDLIELTAAMEDEARKIVYEFACKDPIPPIYVAIVMLRIAHSICIDNGEDIHRLILSSDTSLLPGERYH